MDKVNNHSEVRPATGGNISESVFYWRWFN